MKSEFQTLAGMGLDSRFIIRYSVLLFFVEYVE